MATGFRRNYYCLSNLLVTLDDWAQAVDKGQAKYACYLDISKAFDRIEHTLQVLMLERFCVTGKLFNDYLPNRSNHVRVDGALSKPIAATSGVLQG